MDANELLKKVRQVEIKTRGLSQDIFAGEYHSAFKGRGVTFSEVREYQIGDEIRDIDWNVTARTSRPFVTSPAQTPQHRAYSGQGRFSDSIIFPLRLTAGGVSSPTLPKKLSKAFFSSFVRGEAALFD